MIYLWENPEYYTDKFTAVYNEEISVDRFLFLKGHKLTPEQVSGKLIFELSKVTQAEVTTKYDCIPNNASSPLVNQVVVDLLLELAPDEVQFFDTEVHCKDGVLTHYKLLNATRTFVGIDYEKSICQTMPEMPGIPDSPHFVYGFRYLTYKPGCMGILKLARNEEYNSNLLATEEIKQSFEKNKIKGRRFVEPEKYYC